MTKSNEIRNFLFFLLLEVFNINTSAVNIYETFKYKKFHKSKILSIMT